ncbi:MAG: DUF6036 family nucleotidyltransferase [Vicinamibacterales bacterium]
MRQLVDAARIRQFMRAIGRKAASPGRAYLAGGACAVLLDWRPSTLDIDLELDPSLEPVLKEIPAIKEHLQVNVELASPGHFIPELPGWRDRSPFIAREGSVDFHHYDFYAQALSKIERAHDRDLIDVREMAERRLIDPGRLLEFLDQISPFLYKYPAIAPAKFREAVARIVADLGR